MKSCFVILSFLFLVSCVGSDLMEGGSWFGLNPSHPEAASDAWQPCSDSSQCSEWCQAPEGAMAGAAVKGKCYGGRDHKYICGQAVSNGVAGGTICE